MAKPGDRWRAGSKRNRESGVAGSALGDGRRSGSRKPSTFDEKAVDPVLGAATIRSGNRARRGGATENVRGRSTVAQRLKTPRRDGLARTCAGPRLLVASCSIRPKLEVRRQARIHPGSGLLLAVVWRLVLRAELNLAFKSLEGSGCEAKAAHTGIERITGARAVGLVAEVGCEASSLRHRGTPRGNPRARESSRPRGSSFDTERPTARERVTEHHART